MPIAPRIDPRDALSTWMFLKTSSAIGVRGCRGSLTTDDRHRGRLRTIAAAAAIVTLRRFIGWSRPLFLRRLRGQGSRLLVVIREPLGEQSSSERRIIRQQVHISLVQGQPRFGVHHRVGDLHREFEVSREMRWYVSSTTSLSLWGRPA